MAAKLPADYVVAIVSSFLEDFLRDADSYAGHELLRELVRYTALTEYSANHQGCGMFYRGGKHDGEAADYDDEKGQALIKKAMAGDADADAALCGIAAMFVNSGREMPPHLRGYVFTVLMLRRDAPPHRGKGGDGYAKVGRNAFIVNAVSNLQKMGFCPTRNRATRAQRSGCSIVAEAFSQVGIAIDETAVEKVWARRSRFTVRS